MYDIFEHSFGRKKFVCIFESICLIILLSLSHGFDFQNIFDNLIIDNLDYITIYTMDTFFIESHLLKHII